MDLKIHIFIYVLMVGAHAWAYSKQSLKFFGFQAWPKSYPLHFTLLFSGIILFGLLPILLQGSKSAIEMLWAGGLVSPFWIAIVAFLTVVVCWIGWHQAHLVEISHDQAMQGPGWKLLLIYFPCRAIFLVSYEMWFRGWLLQDLLAAYDLVIAIAINLSMYFLIHLFAGKKESTASIPFGLLLYWLAIQTGAVWPAALIHLSFSLAYELGLIHLSSKINTTK